MTKNKIVLALQQEIPALEATAEGQLRGGFSAMTAGAPEYPDSGNSECGNNTNCDRNRICNNNTSCTKNGVCRDNTVTPTPTPSSSSTSACCCSFNATSFLLGF